MRSDIWKWSALTLFWFVWICVNFVHISVPLFVFVPGQKPPVSLLEAGGVGSLMNNVGGEPLLPGNITIQNNYKTGLEAALYIHGKSGTLYSIQYSVGWPLVSKMFSGLPRFICHEQIGNTDKLMTAVFFNVRANGEISKRYVHRV